MFLFFLIRVPLLVTFLAYLAKMWLRLPLEYWFKSYLVLLERVDDLDVPQPLILRF